MVEPTRPRVTTWLEFPRMNLDGPTDVRARRTDRSHSLLTDEPNEAMFALGFTNYWDTYFAGRAAPWASSRPRWWKRSSTTFLPARWLATSRRCGEPAAPELAIAARRRGCVKALRRILGDRVDLPALSRATELLMKAATSSPFEGRPMCRGAACNPDSRRKGGWSLPCGVLASRAPWRRAHRGPDERGCRRPRGACALGPRHGHAGGEVRTHPPPSRQPARRRDRRDARIAA